jgi:hypothetical protein
MDYWYGVWRSVMKRLRLPWVLVSVMIFAMSGMGGVLASHDVDNPLIGHIVVNTPDEDIYSCVDETTSTDISFTNVNDPNDPDVKWWLKGQIVIEYITDTGRELVPGGFIDIDFEGDLFLTIYYPPVSEWPVLSNGTAEIHVDVQLEVLDENRNMVGHIGLGPGHDWDVFCLTPPPPDEPGAEGCTPGYWKNHLTAWEDTSYSPDDSFSTVFGVTATGNPTLLQALNEGGGGEEALFRHATAGLLNASIAGVDYAYTVAEVIQIVQNAYATGDFETAKNLLEAENERGCTLEGYSNTTGGGPPVGAKIEKKSK